MKDPVVPSDVTGTIGGSGFIQPALQGAAAPFNRYFWRQRHYPPGTTGGSGTIQSALSEAAAPFNRYYWTQRHYSAGTIRGSDNIQPALLEAAALFNPQYWVPPIVGRIPTGLAKVGDARYDRGTVAFWLIPFTIFALSFLLPFPPSSKFRSGVTNQALFPHPHYVRAFTFIV